MTEFLTKPVQMAFDPQGRLWVAVWPTYPHWKPKEEMNDKILILEDTNKDGKADVCKTFADKLHVFLVTVIGIAVLGHLAAVLVHRFIDRDGVAQRMNWR